MFLAPVVASIVLTALAQIMLKVGVSNHAIQSALSNGNTLRFVTAVASSPIIIAGLACYALSAAVWLLALARLDLSVAYPFIALTILITVAAGYFMLGEPVSRVKLAGMFAIVVGVSLMGTSIEPGSQAAGIARSDAAR